LKIWKYCVLGKVFKFLVCLTKINLNKRFR